jgi:hypothetical protein
MSQAKWWVRWPGRLKWELQQLKKAGIVYDHDREALRAGVVRLYLTLTINGKPRRLSVTFPDSYPYFRFEIAAPDENLPYHQHPQSKYLCLLGRSTHYWNTDDTVARLLQEQLPKVFSTAESADREEVAGVEHHQAEPFSDYYTYAPSMLTVQSGNR